MIKKYFLSVSLLLIALGAFSQEVTFKASAPSVVQVGQRFNFTYTLKNAQGEELLPGNFSDFDVLGGPNQGSSSNVSIVNGRVQQSRTFTYSYVLQAKKEGKFTIDAAKMKAGGKSYTCNAVTIEVVKGNPSKQQSNSNSGTANISRDDLFLKVLVNKSSVYQGEAITATVKIFTTVDIIGFDGFEQSEFNNFWKEDIETNNQISLKRENINGKVYGTAILKKFVLIPQKSGNLTLDPVELGCVIRQRVKSQRRGRDPFDSFFDDIFDRGYQKVKKNIKSKPIKIKVKALPVGASASFNGAVGNYSLKASLTKSEVKANESITLKTKISGTGNLKLVDVPTLELPADFENYDPEVSNNFKVNGSNLSGSKSVEYLMIPRFEGTYTIPAVEFTYFDPSARKYKTLSDGPFEINVLPGEGGEGVHMVDRPSVGKQDLKILGNDIRYIKTGDLNLEKSTSSWFGTASYYATYVGSLGLAAFFFVFLSKRRKDQANQVEYKSKNAGKFIQKSLKEAKLQLDQKDASAFYKSMLQGIWGYLGDKLKMEKSTLNKDSMQEALTQRNVSETTISELTALVNQCQMAQYAPVGGEAEMQSNYDKAVAVMTQLQNELKAKS